MRKREREKNAVKKTLLTFKSTINKAVTKLTQHLLLLLRQRCSQHGGRQGLLTLHMHSRLEKQGTVFKDKNNRFTVKLWQSAGVGY